VNQYPDVTVSPRLRLEALERRGLLARAEQMRRQADDRRHQETLAELGRLTARVAAHSGLVARTLESIRDKSREVGDTHGISEKRALLLSSNAVPPGHATAVAGSVDEEREARSRKLKAWALAKFKPNAAGASRGRHAL
jgi:hypothetical protein